MIEFKEGRYVSFIAFVYGEQDRDWLACGYKDPGGQWTVNYRFRYYNPASTSPFDELDEKREYQAVCADDVDEEYFAENTRAIARALVARGFNDRFDWLPVGSADPKFIIGEMRKQPWFHFKQEEATS